jgi:hypothetical protein
MATNASPQITINTLIRASAIVVPHIEESALIVKEDIPTISA